MDQDVADLLAELDEDAWTYRPRPFALYGVYRRDRSQAFLGWGVEFAALRKAVMWLADSSHHGNSAAQILEFYETIAEARLVWLDAPAAAA